MKTQKIYTFKEGDRFTLDDIYDIQGLAAADRRGHACISKSCRP